ncbi:MAG: hypothetical protein Q8N30_05760 [Methylococcales bacterium]|nr:hypothetical protein [Methylococcales bacterium]
MCCSIINPFPWVEISQSKHRAGVSDKVPVYGDMQNDLWKTPISAYVQTGLF